MRKDQEVMQHRFSDLRSDEIERQLVDMTFIEQLLSSRNIFNRVPNFVNGRQTKLNVDLIKTSLVIVTRGFMDFRQLREAMNGFETHCKSINSDTLPLNEKSVQEAIRPIGLSLTTMVF